MRRFRKLAVILGLTALIGASTGTVSAADPVTLETQSWWNKAGIQIPNAVGSHVHVKTTMPAEGTILNGTLTLPITVTLHDAKGKTNWFRMGTQDKELLNIPLVLGPCSDCSKTFNVSLNIGQLTTGRHELRMSANIPDEDPALIGSQRMYQSSGFQFCVRSCSPSYRSGHNTIGRGWYSGHDYANVSLHSHTSAVKQGGSVSRQIFTRWGWQLWRSIS